MTRLRLWTATLLGVALAGCAIGPDYERPALPEPETFRGQTTPAEAASFADLPWWEVFQDEVLRGLISEALQSNYDLRIAAARVEQARALAGISRSEFFPQINGEFDATRGTNAVLGAPSPGAPRDNAFLLAASMAWELDVWGRIRRSNQAAQADLLATEAFRRGVVLSLVSGVASAYFQLRELDRKLEISRETVAAYAETYDLFERKYQGGAASRLPTLRADALRASAAASVPELERRIVATENLLSVLLGRPPGDIPRGVAIEAQETPPQIPVGMPAALLERRPDLIESEQVLVAANARVGVAVSEFLPRIGLTGLLGGVSTELSDVLQKRDAMWSIAGVATTPIFRGGAIFYNWKRAKAEWEQAKLSYESTALTALQEVSDALTAREKFAVARKEQQQAVTSLDEAVRIARVRYFSGLSTYFEVLNAQQDLFPAQLLLAQIEREQLDAVVALYRSLGGGWSQYAAQPGATQPIVPQPPGSAPPPAPAP